MPLSMAQYCTSCGAELSSQAEYCGKCGKPIDETESEEAVSLDEQSGDGEKEQPESWTRYLPGTWQIGVAGGVFGLVIGGLAAWALANIGASGVGFLIAFVAGTVYLWQKPTASGAIGSGLYISALMLIVVPLLFYGPMIGQSEDPQTAEEMGMAAGSILGLFIWTVVFGIIAAVLAALGYFSKKRQKKKLAA